MNIKDRVSIDLPEGQKWLIGNVSAALAGSGKPVIAVTYGGGVSGGGEGGDSPARSTRSPCPLLLQMPDVSSILADTGVGALLHAGYPSVQVLGVGDVIFG